MKLWWTLLVAMVPGVLGAQRPLDGALLEDLRYQIPAFAQLTAGQARDVGRAMLTATQYDSLRGVVAPHFRKVSYGSDGLRVVAYLLHSNVPAGRRPVIVYARGSFVAGDMAPALLATMWRLADSGYVVVAPQYRGSDGGEGTDEMGGADVADLHNAIRLAKSLPNIDSSRVYLYGESRGGMMVFQALRDGAGVAAAATVGAFTDLDSLLAADPRSAAAASQLWPTYATQREQIAQRRSAARWPETIKRPLLILHGGSDGQVSPQQSLRLASALQRLGAEYELRIISGGSHTMSEMATTRDAAAMAWFGGFPHARPRP